MPKDIAYIYIHIYKYTSPRLVEASIEIIHILNIRLDVR